MNNDLFHSNNYTKKEMPTLYMVFDNLMGSNFLNGMSDQRQEFFNEHRELHKKREDLFRMLNSEQQDIVNDDDEMEAELHYMELSEKFCAGFKLCAQLMLELMK